MNVRSCFLAIFCLLYAWSSFGSAKTTRLALNWKPEPQFGGFYAAEIGGHYKANGLHVELLPGGAGTPVVQMVAAGKMPFGIASADEVIISRSRGADVIALFATYQTNPQGIMVHGERPYQSLQDVYRDANGTLALQNGLPYAMFLDKKLGPAKIKIVPYQGGITGFLADKLYSQQCFITSEPIAARKGGAKPKTFLVAEVGYNPYTTVLVTNGATLKRDPALVKAMVVSVRLGWAEYLKASRAANDVMRKLNPSMDAMTFQESAEAQKNLIETDETKTLGLGAMTVERWNQLADQLLDLKVIQKKPDIDSLFRAGL